MKSQPTVSVIIPFKRVNEFVHETLKHLCVQSYSDFEVILLPDEQFEFEQGYDSFSRPASPSPTLKIRIVPTGPCGPAMKRDIALAHSTGDILAFLDDDTYPEQSWMANAIVHFRDQSVAAVGGPAVTPPSNGLMRQASGYVYESLLGGGPYAYRYAPRQMRQVDDYPTCNLLVRRSVFEALGGFDTAFWPGEDTKLCLDITHKLGLKILYVPDALVYHHRRPLFRHHLRQAREYALHRGYFAKRFPQTSLRPSYFLPSILVGLLLTGALAVAITPSLFNPYAATITSYLLAAVASAGVTSKSLKLWPLVAAGIIATHVVYGVFFVRGLMSARLAEEGHVKDSSLQQPY